MERLEQKPAHKPPEPPIYRLPRPKSVRQHPPAAVGPGEIADGIEDLAQVHVSLASLPGGPGQEGPDPRPFLIRQVGRIAPPLESRLALATLFCPYPPHVVPRFTQPTPCGILKRALMAAQRGSAGAGFTGGV